MAHNLAKHASGEHSLAFTGERRAVWHGLGQQIPADATWKQVLAAAHLDYEVERWPLEARYASLTGGLGETLKVDTGHAATVRTDTRQVLGVVGRAYTVMQNRDAFAWLDGFEGIRYETAGALGKGELVWIMARDPRQDFTVRGEQIKSYLALWNGHDGRKTIGGGFTPVRIVCQNTFGLALRGHVEHRFSIRHTANAFEQLDEAARVMGLHRDYMRTFHAACEELALRALTPRQATDYFAELMPEPEPAAKAAHTIWTDKQQLLADLFRAGAGNRGESAWDAVNAVAEFADHFRRQSGDSEQRKAENRLHSALFGSTLDLKQRAWDLAVERFAAAGTAP